MNVGDADALDLASETARTTAADAGLGERVAVHEQSAGRRRRFWVITILGLAAAGLFLALGAAAIVAGSNSDQGELAWGSAVPIGIALLVVIIFILSLRRMLGPSGTRRTGAPAGARNRPYSGTPAERSDGRASFP